jgi:hypothetical protein
VISNPPANPQRLGLNLKADRLRRLSCLCSRFLFPAYRSRGRRREAEAGRSRVYGEGEVGNSELNGSWCVGNGNL